MGSAKIGKHEFESTSNDQIILCVGARGTLLSVTMGCGSDQSNELAIQNAMEMRGEKVEFIAIVPADKLLVPKPAQK